MEKESITGSWELASFEIIKPGASAKPWGDKVCGILIYSPCGFMSVNINRDVNGNDPQSVVDSSLCYAGTYKLIGNEIRHKVLNASNPTRVGKEMIRFASLDNDLLELTTPEESYGTAKLIWRRSKDVQVPST